MVVPGAYSTPLSLFLSISAVLSHLPYVLGLLKVAKKRGESLSGASEFGKRNALKRLEAGANRKDLFYYLVCQHVELGVLTSLNLVIERRRSP